MRWVWLLLVFFVSDANAEEIWLGATTTLRDSGFLDAVLPVYEELSGDKVIVLAQSTGQITQSAKDGNVDLLLTHHEGFERALLDEGLSLSRIELMASRFVLVGPKSDPANVRNLDIDLAFETIAAIHPIFLTRGDASGTYEREMSIWERNHITDLGFRIETGQGMGATLNMASVLDGYLLSEIASFLQFQNKGSLDILTKKGDGLENIYAISQLNPEKFPKRNLDGADRLIAFLTSDSGRKIINSFKIDGESPFTTEIDDHNDSKP